MYLQIRLVPLPRFCDSSRRRNSLFFISFWPLLASVQFTSDLPGPASLVPRREDFKLRSKNSSENPLCPSQILWTLALPWPWHVKVNRSVDAEAQCEEAAVEDIPRPTLFRLIYPGWRKFCIQHSLIEIPRWRSIGSGQDARQG
jgi:hypothetical protein